MDNGTTNFFEIFISPPIQNLFQTEITNASNLASPDNVITKLTKDTLISLHPLENSQKLIPKIQYLEWLLKKLLFEAIQNSDSFFDIDYMEGEATLINERLIQRTEYSVLRRLIIRVFYSVDRFLIAIDPRTKIYSRLSLNRLLGEYGYQVDYFLQHDSCLVFVENKGDRKWVRGRIRDIINANTVKVEVDFLFRGTIEVTSGRVIPLLNKSALRSIVKRTSTTIDFDKETKQLSEFTSERKEKTILEIFNSYIKPIFPIKVKNTLFSIAYRPLEASLFKFYKIPAQSEPEYIIKREGLPVIKDKRRLVGLSKANITSNIQDHPVVLFASSENIETLNKIVSSLNDGITSGQYTFSMPNRFGIRLNVTDNFIIENYAKYDFDTDLFLLSNEDKHKDALAIIYLPPNSEFYYPIKAKLAHYGRVSQVVSHPHFDIYAAWNLGANIFAKLGHIPWGISESEKMPNADIVLGFAYSSLEHEGRLKRNIGYVNVFDKNGIWQFMQSSASYLDFDKRIQIIPQLIKNAIVSFIASGSSPQIIDIHYSKKFSFRERQRTSEVIKSIVPTIQQINFVSLDKTHPLRIFDHNNKSLNVLRGGIFQLNTNEFLLSVAGEDKPNAQTSRLLKLKVWSDPYIETLDIVSIAYRVLAMTKLNWRSAVRETTDPVTIKYSEEIANLTNHFSITEWKTVNNQLSRIPWFI